MQQSFGARLRQRREQQGISLAVIAEQTKIKRSLLDALERDDVSHWPAGFFGRGFIRAYAQTIGLNPDTLVREFLAAHPEPDSAPATAPSAARLPIESHKDTASALDFEAVARLCTDFGRVQTADELQALLQQAADLLDATGVILWAWHGASSELKPALAHGYSDAVLAQLPAVRPDTNNATASAFRLQQTFILEPGDHTRGAIAVPLLTPAGCAGVFAIELKPGAKRTSMLRAAATIFAAVLAQVIAP